MGDKPIIFSAPMIRALMAGRKTQTRRVLKPQPTLPWGSASHAGKSWWTHDSLTGDVIETWRLRYAVGDRLYVREAFSYETLDVDRNGFMPPWYWADGNPRSGDYMRPKPSIHMPRWASRLTLTVTDVRVQRLQEISEADVLAEGCPLDPHYHDTTSDGSNPHMVNIDAGRWQSPRAWYHQLWNSLHGPDAWGANPWIVAVSFTVQHGNIDQIGGTHD